MKKTLLLLVTLMLNYLILAQVPSGAIAEYRFSGGSLSNSVNPGVGNLVPDEGGFNFREDRDNITASALRNLQRTFTGITLPASINNPLENFSVSMWYLFENPIVNANWEGVFQIFDNQDYGIRVQKIAQSDFAISLFWGPTALERQIFFISNSALTGSNWAHLTFTVERNGSDITVKSYINGVLQSPYSGQNTATVNTGFIKSDATFTLSPEISSFGLRSATDDIRLYDRTLVASEVADLAAEPGVGPTLLSRVYVDSSSQSNLGGTTWATAVPSVNEALLVAAPGAEIWVKQGVYKNLTGNVQTSVVAVNKQVSILGGFNGTETVSSQRDPQTNPTIFSGDRNDNDSVVIEDNTLRSDNNTTIFFIDSDGVILDGITIKDAHGADSLSTVFGSGAIFMNNTRKDLTITNCIIEDNLARSRGSVVLYEPLNVGNSSFVMDRCIIRNNLSARGGVRIGARNGTNLTASITNSLFANNIAEDLPGPVTFNSGSAINALVLEDGGTTGLDIVNCTFASNTDDIGTTVLVEQPENDNDFVLNIFNSVFFDSRVNGNVVTPIAAAGITSRSYTIDVNTNITDVDFINIPDVNETNTILNTTPGFANSASDDYRPLTSSIMIDAGTNAFNSTSLDLDGNTRIANTIIDIGAYEFQNQLSLNDFSGEVTFTFYPNPVKDVITILSDQSLSEATIYSVLGREVLRTNQSSINISRLKTGIYLICVETKGGNLTTQKFIKN